MFSTNSHSGKSFTKNAPSTASTSKKKVLTDQLCLKKPTQLENRSVGMTEPKIDECRSASQAKKAGDVGSKLARYLVKFFIAT